MYPILLFEIVFTLLSMLYIVHWMNWTKLNRNIHWKCDLLRQSCSTPNKQINRTLGFLTTGRTRALLLKAACLESRTSRIRPPLCLWVFKETMFLPRSLVNIQYCGKPPWPRGSVLGLRPPGSNTELCVSLIFVQIVATTLTTRFV